MILRDFLSRQRTDYSNPHEIIPISFNMQAILRDRYYNIRQKEKNRYLIQIWSQSKISGIKLPEVNKGIEPRVKPEKQILKPIKLGTESNPQSKLRLGQGRAGLRRKMKIPVQIQSQIQTSGGDQVKEQTLPKQKEVVQPPLTKLSTDRSIGHMPETDIIPHHTIRTKINTRQVPFYPDPLIKPPLRLPVTKTQDNRRMTLDVDFDINKDFEENSPYQEGIISKTYQRPDKSQFLEPPELADFDQYQKSST